MWQYFWPHFVYHLMRWFPRDNRKKIFVLLAIFSLALLVPQFYVLVLKKTTRWCIQPLFQLLIVSIVFTIVAIGFTLLFMLMNPVPRLIKFVFHVFGVICFIEGLVHIGLTSQAAECKNTTDELYQICYGYSWVCAISIIFFFLMLPFWVINVVKRDSVLDTRMRTGVCYEPVSCCSCLWHV